MCEPKIVIIRAEMSVKMKQDVVDCAKQALEKYEKMSVSQYTELSCLVGWLAVCELPSIDTLSFFRMLQST